MSSGIHQKHQKVTRRLQLVQHQLNTLDKHTQQLIRLWHVEKESDRMFSELCKCHSYFGTQTNSLVSANAIRTLEQALYDYQAEETCLRFALNKYRPSYLRTKSPPVQSRDIKYAAHFSKIYARAMENMTMLRCQLRSIFFLRQACGKSTNQVQALWTNVFLPCENQNTELKNRVVAIMKEEDLRTTKDPREDRRDLRASKLVRKVQFDVNHFNHLERKDVKQLQQRALDGKSLSCQSIVHRHAATHAGVFGTNVDASVDWNTAIAKRQRTRAVNTTATTGSLLLSNLQPLPFEEKLELQPRGKNRVRLPRLFRPDPSLHEQPPFVVFTN